MFDKHKSDSVGEKWFNRLETQPLFVKFLGKGTRTETINNHSYLLVKVVGKTNIINSECFKSYLNNLH